MKISVIVAVFNGARYIEKCVNSLLNQTLNEIEIIIVNDGSTDKTEEILGELSQKYSNIIVVNQANLGVSAARNKGLQEVNGEYVGFIDADDYCEKNMFEDMYNTAKATESDVVVSGIIVDFYESKKVNIINVERTKCSNDNEEIKRLIIELEKLNMFNFVWNKLYKKDIVKDIAFNESFTTGEDLIFNCEVFKDIKKMVIINKAYYHYMRGNETTIVTSYKPNLHDMIKKLNDERINLYKQREIIEKSDVKLMYNKCIEYYISCVWNIFRKDNKLDHIQRYKQLKLIFNDEFLHKNLIFFESNNLNKKIFNIVYKIKFNLIRYVTYHTIFWFKYNIK